MKCIIFLTSGVLSLLAQAAVNQKQLDQLDQSVVTCQLVSVQVSNTFQASPSDNYKIDFTPTTDVTIISNIQKGNPEQKVPDQLCMPIPKDTNDKYGLATGGYSCYNIWLERPGFQGYVEQFDLERLDMNMDGPGSTDTLSISFISGEGRIDYYQGGGWPGSRTDTTGTVLLKKCSLKTTN